MTTAPKLYAINPYPKGLNATQGVDVARVYMTTCELSVKTFSKMTGIPLSRLRRLMMENSQVEPSEDELVRLRDTIAKDTEARRQRLREAGQLVAD